MGIEAIPTAKHPLPNTEFSTDATSGTCMSNVWEVQKETFPKDDLMTSPQCTAPVQGGLGCLEVGMLKAKASLLSAAAPANGRPVAALHTAALLLLLLTYCKISQLK